MKHAVSTCFPLAVAVRAGKILLSVDMLLLSVVFIYTGESLLTGLEILLSFVCVLSHRLL